MKKLVAVAFLFLLSVAAQAQSTLAAASQVMKLPDDVASIAIWPLDLASAQLDESLINAASDEIEQALTRKAREKKLKVFTRRQLQGVVREVKLSSMDKTSFEGLAKKTGADVIMLPTATLSKSGCLTITLKALGTAGNTQGEVINASKPFKFGTRTGDLDVSGCD
jgi:hypothetical protein